MFDEADCEQTKLADPSQSLFLTLFFKQRPLLISLTLGQHKKPLLNSFTHLCQTWSKVTKKMSAMQPQVVPSVVTIRQLQQWDWAVPDWDLQLKNRFLKMNDEGLDDIFDLFQSNQV